MDDACGVRQNTDWKKETRVVKEKAAGLLLDLSGLVFPYCCRQIFEIVKTPSCHVLLLTIF